jgi:hypothetical protein
MFAVRGNRHRIGSREYAKPAVAVRFISDAVSCPATDERHKRQVSGVNAPLFHFSTSAHAFFHEAQHVLSDAS